MKDLTYKGFDHVGPAEYIQRVFEDKYWLDDGLQEEVLTNLWYVLVVRTMSHPVRAAVNQVMRVIVVNACLSTEIFSCSNLACQLLCNFCTSMAL